MINIISSNFFKLILLVLSATVLSCGEPRETASKKEPSLPDKPSISPTPSSSPFAQPAVKEEGEEGEKGEEEGMEAPKAPATPQKAPAALAKAPVVASPKPSTRAQMNKCVNKLLAETIGTEPPTSEQAKEAKKVCAKKLGILSLP